ncbi:hypothetical protein D3C81_2179020 [compost metagenome]
MAAPVDLKDGRDMIVQKNSGRPGGLIIRSRFAAVCLLKLTAVGQPRRLARRLGAAACAMIEDPDSDFAGS